MNDWNEVWSILEEDEKSVNVKWYITLELDLDKGL